MFRILAINPGSTSTKIALYEDEYPHSQLSLSHSSEDLKRFPSVWDQYEFRLSSVRAGIVQWGENGRRLDAVVGRGGLLRPVKGGTYRVDSRMLADARANLQGEPVSNLACALADEIAKEHRTEAFIVDPVSVDEFEPLARYSGHPLIERRALAHTLNIHAVARRAAKRLGKPVDETDLVVAHLGGGISVAPLRGGRIIDVNDASSDGPFSPERTGGLPLQQFITLCFSGKYTEAEVRKLVMGRGGVLAYLETSDATAVESRIAGGDVRAREVYEAMAYQIAKEIGAMSTVLRGKVDGIVISGGLAKSKMLVDWIQARVAFIAPVIVFPGDDELLALVQGVLCVLRGDEDARTY